MAGWHRQPTPTVVREQDENGLAWSAMLNFTNISYGTYGSVALSLYCLSMGRHELTICALRQQQQVLPGADDPERVGIPSLPQVGARRGAQPAGERVIDVDSHTVWVWI